LEPGEGRGWLAGMSQNTPLCLALPRERKLHTRKPASAHRRQMQLMSDRRRIAGQQMEDKAGRGRGRVDAEAAPQHHSVGSSCGTVVPTNEQILEQQLRYLPFIESTETDGNTEEVCMRQSNTGERNYANEDRGGGGAVPQLCLSTSPTAPTTPTATTATCTPTRTTPPTASTATLPSLRAVRLWLVLIILTSTPAVATTPATTEAATTRVRGLQAQGQCRHPARTAQETHAAERQG
jgi:hypothetical protein